MSSSSSFPSSSSSSSSSPSSSSSLFSSFSQLGDSLLFHSRLSVEEIGVHTPALQKNCRSLSRQTSSRSRTLSKDSLSFSTRERDLDLPSSSYSSSFSSSSSSRESERDNCPSPSSSSPPSVSSSPHFSSSSSHLLPSSSSVSSSISSPSSMRGYAPPFLWYFSHRFSPLQSVKTSLSIPLSLLLLFLSFSLFFTSLISLFCSLSSSFSSSFSSSGLRPPSLGSSLSSSSSFPFFVSSVNTFLFSSFSSPLGETSTPVSVSLSSSSSSFLLPLLLHVEASSSPSFSSSERPGEVKRREAEGEERKENEEGKTGENKKKTPLFPNQVESEDGGEFGFKAFLNFLREELHRRHEEEERRRDREETGDRKDQDIRDSQQGAKEDEEKEEEEESSEAKEESSDPSSTDREKKGEPSHKIDTEEEEGETPDTDEEEEEGEEERRRREELLSSSSSAAAGQESFSHEQHEEDSAERLRLGDRQKEGRGDTPSPRSSSSSADRRMKDREEEGDRQGEEKREDEKEGGKKTRERIRRKERPKMIDVFSHGMYLVEKYGRIAKAFSIFQECAEYDVRCQYEAGVYYFLGLPPLLDRNLTSTLMLWNAAALRGSAEAQYALSILHSNLYYLPHLPAFPSSKRISSSSPPSSSPSPPSSSSSPSPSPPSSPSSSSPSDAVVGKEMFPRVSIDRTDYSVHVKRRRRSEERRDERAISEVEKEKRRGQEEEDGEEEEDFDFSRIIRFSEMLQERHREEIAYEQSLWRRPFKVLSHLYFLFSTAFRSLFHSSSFPPSPSLDGFHSSLSSDRTSSASSSSSLDTGKKKEKGEEDEEDREVKRNRPSLLQSDGVDIDLPSLPNFASMPPLTSIHLYASSVASHPGALMSSAMKIKGGSVEHPLRQAQACTSAANYYLPYAKLVAEAYSSGIPQAPELIRLHSPTLAVNSQGQGISPSSSSSSSSSSSIFFSFFSSFSSSFVSYFSPSTISSLFSRLSSLLFSSSSAFDTRERDTRGGSSLDVPEEEDLRQASSSSSSSSLSHARRDLVGEEEGFDIGEGRESFIDSLLTGKHLHGKDEEEENAEEEDLWSEERRKESNRGGGGQGGFSLNRLGEVFYPSYDILRDLAEEQGDTRMELALGKRFLFGVDGFPQDFKKAYKYLTLASSSSSDEDLPEREEEEEEGGGGGERSSKKKRGGRPSSNSHGEWRAEAESLLGYMHALGVGVDRSPHPRNITEATLHFLSAAAEHRHPIALNGLGYLHFFGSDYVEQNIQAAFHFFNASSSQNFPDAQNNLAALHLTGH
ncbi:sel1 repeat-containing protein, partial [Cystoisospora suis]